MGVVPGVPGATGVAVGDGRGTGPVPCGSQQAVREWSICRGANLPTGTSEGEGTWGTPEGEGTAEGTPEGTTEGTPEGTAEVAETAGGVAGGAWI